MEHGYDIYNAIVFFMVIHVLSFPSPLLATTSKSRDHMLLQSNYGTCHVSTVEYIRTFHGNTDVVYSLSDRSGNRFISASEDETIKVWDYTTGKRIHTFEGHGDYVCSVAAFGAKLCISGSDDATIKLWRTGRGRNNLRKTAVTN